MKIPTLLGLALIITLIALAGLYYYYSPAEETASSVEVSNLKVANVTQNSATVVWQTATPVVGEVWYGESESNYKSAIDARDTETKRGRLIHFINIADLKPGTTYKYKIKNDTAFFLDAPLEFKTVQEDQAPDELTFSYPKPLKGTILNANLNPIDESLVFLDIPGASSLVTFSSLAGNFVLPLKAVYDKDLSKPFVIAEGTKGVLSVVRGNLKSNVKLAISEKAMNLPPITIGANLDLEKFETAPINQITFSTIPAIGGDFNGDQKVNSLDLALLKEAASSGANTQSSFDINRDGIVDLDDVNEFSEKLGGN